MMTARLLQSFFSKKIAIVAKTQDINLFSLANMPKIPGTFIFTIGPRSTINQKDALASIDVGQFEEGSVIIIHNHGKILGRDVLHGSAGDAIKADYPNQRVIIINHDGAMCYAGRGVEGKPGSYLVKGQNDVSFTNEEGARVMGHVS